MTIEGTYKDGKVKLEATPPVIGEARVLVTFLPTPETEARGVGGRIFFGMFKGDRKTDEEDFRVAEWRGESEDSDGD
jgi:hypothetical protein